MGGAVAGERGGARWGWGGRAPGMAGGAAGDGWGGRQGWRVGSPGMGGVIRGDGGVHRGDASRGDHGEELAVFALPGVAADGVAAIPYGAPGGVLCVISASISRWPRAASKI